MRPLGSSHITIPHALQYSAWSLPSLEHKQQCELHVSKGDEHAPQLGYGQQFTEHHGVIHICTDTLQLVHDTSMHMGRNAGKNECKPLVQPTMQSVALCTIAFRLSCPNILTCTLAGSSCPLSSRARGLCVCVCVYDNEWYCTCKLHINDKFQVCKTCMCLPYSVSS